MDVSVCIVNWNTKDMLANCINSLLDKTCGISYEIIIVDNNSADGSAEMIRHCFPQCKLVDSKQNLGFARGNNLGFREATGKYILFLNPDTILITNAVYGMFMFLEAHDDVGAVGSKLLNQDKTIQFTCARTYPTLLNQLSDLMMLNRLFPKSSLFSTIEMSYWDHNNSQYVDCLSGACLFVRKSLIEMLNGFDENIFMYAEEVDLCFRIKKAGWKLYYLANEEIYHLDGASSKKRSEKYFSVILQRQSNFYYFLKHFGIFQAQLYRTIFFLGSIFRMLIVLLSIMHFQKDRIQGQRRSYIFLKYWNILLWSVGIKKITPINP
jgi:GT2 family glycosyltransferase